MTRILGDMRWTVFFAVMAGLSLAVALPNPVWRAYDYLFPVVTMRAEVVRKLPNEVVIRLVGRKHARYLVRECKYVAIDAFSRVADLLRDVSMVRLDAPQVYATKPPGDHDFGTWRVWPTAATKDLVIYVQYDCDGRTVFVQAAEVAL